MANEVRARRIAENHAIAFAGFALLNSLMEWKSEDDLKPITEYMIQLGKTKIETAKSETPSADTFLELLESIPDGDAVQRRGNNLYFRMGEAMKAIEWPKGSSRDLTAEFKKHDNFKGNKNDRVFGLSDPVKVWHFEMQPLPD